MNVPCIQLAEAWAAKSESAKTMRLVESMLETWILKEWLMNAIQTGNDGRLWARGKELAGQRGHLVRIEKNRLGGQRTASRAMVLLEVPVPSGDTHRGTVVSAIVQSIFDAETTTRRRARFTRFQRFSTLAIAPAAPRPTLGNACYSSRVYVPSVHRRLIIGCRVTWLHISA